jgi:hypothetical protein
MNNTASKGDVASNIMSELYKLDHPDSLDEVMNTKITAKLNSRSAGLYTALANRFGITRFELIQQVLDDSSKKLFELLEPSDRAQVAEQADIETFEILKKQGMTSLREVGVRGAFDGSGFWRNYLTEDEIDGLEESFKAAGDSLADDLAKKEDSK